MPKPKEPRPWERGGHFMKPASRERGNTFEDPGSTQAPPPDPAPPRAPAATVTTAATTAPAAPPPSPTYATGGAGESAGGLAAGAADAADSDDPVQHSNLSLRESQWEWLDLQAKLLGRRRKQRVRRGEVLRLLIDAMRDAKLSLNSPEDAGGHVTVTLRVLVAPRPE